MIIKLKALDTLFFRDGKPFNKGDETWASGVFPPAPSVFYGSIRSAYIAQNLDKYSLKELIEKTEKLRIKQISFEVYAPIMDDKKSEVGQYFPLPKDLVKRKSVNSDEAYKRKKYKINKTYKLQLSSEIINSSNSTAKLLKSPFGEEVEEVDNGIIHSLAFRKYLQGRDEEYFEGRELNQFLTNEPKVGIGKDNDTNTTTDGLLYRVGMQRTDYIQAIIDFEEIEGLKLAESGFLKLGGEGKSVFYESEEGLDITFKMTKLADNESQFKIYLGTPALFKKGWYPSEIFKKANVQVELIAAALGKPFNIGGFDMAKGEPKKMLKAIPAGSVYYYKLESGNLEKLFDYLKQNTISEERGQEGFGIAYLAKI
jgi:CRISPR-associated protein Cmr3